MEDTRDRDLMKFRTTSDKLKYEIIKKYNKKGKSGKLYAKLASLFDFKLVDDKVLPTAAVYPGLGLIIVNGNLDYSQIDAVVKHEMMHEWYNHQKRLEEYCADHYEDLCAWLKYDADDVKKDKNLKSIVGRLHTISNYAGDYDISNRAYTDDDKKVFRALIHGAETLKCLVTEDDHPGWETLSYAEMMDKLVEEEKNKPQQPPQQQQNSSGNQSGDGQSSNQQNNQGSQSGQPDGGQQDDSEFNNQGGHDDTVIHGKFIDSHTFLDKDGNQIDLNNLDESLVLI